MPADQTWRINTPEINSWHSVHITVAQNFRDQLQEHLKWLDDNIHQKNWRLPGESQISNLWVYKFRTREDAVRFTLVFG
jgi:hypothetical protein